MTTNVSQLNERLLIIKEQSFVNRASQLTQRTLIFTEPAVADRISTVYNLALVVTEAPVQTAPEVHAEYQTALILVPPSTCISEHVHMSLIVTDGAPLGVCVSDVISATLIATDPAPTDTSISSAWQQALIVTDPAPFGATLIQASESALVVTEEPYSTTNAAQLFQVALHLAPDDPSYTWAIGNTQVTLIQLEEPTPDPSRAKSLISEAIVSTTMLDPINVRSTRTGLSLIAAAVVPATYEQTVQSDSLIGGTVQSVALAAETPDPSLVHSDSLVNLVTVATAISAQMTKPNLIQSFSCVGGLECAVAIKGTFANPITFTSMVMANKIIMSSAKIAQYGPAEQQSMNQVYATIQQTAKAANYPERIQSNVLVPNVSKKIARVSTKYVNGDLIRSARSSAALVSETSIKATYRSPLSIAEIQRLNVITISSCMPAPYEDPTAFRASNKNHQLVMETTTPAAYTDPTLMDRTVRFVEQCAQHIALATTYPNPINTRYQRRVETSTYFVNLSES